MLQSIGERPKCVAMASGLAICSDSATTGGGKGEGLSPLVPGRLAQATWPHTKIGMIDQVPEAASAGLGRRYLVLTEARTSMLGISGGNGQAVNAGSTGAAGADSIEVELAEIGSAKGHGELAEHLLVSQVLGSERPLAGVQRPLASALVLAGVLVAAAPGEGPRQLRAERLGAVGALAGVGGHGSGRAGVGLGGAVRGDGGRIGLVAQGAANTISDRHGDDGGDDDGLDCCFSGHEWTD